MAEDSDAEQRRLIEALRAAKPAFLKDGYGIQGPTNNPIAADNDVKRTDFPPGSIQRQPRQASFPPANSVEETQRAARQITPFFVSKSTGAGGLTVLKVYPGKIAGIIPTIGGVKLDNNPKPSQSLVGATAPFSLFLRAAITVDNDNLFRSAISAVTVRTDNDPIMIPDIDGVTSEVPELKIIWEDGSTHQTGHFYIKIADIDVNGASQVTGIIQWLFTSYRTFASNGSDVEIMARD